jgi:hypothetical protein
MSKWSIFLYKLGKFVTDSKLRDGQRPAVVVSVPSLDFASVLVSSGIVAGQLENTSAIEPNLEHWRSHIGSAVLFPRIRENEEGSSIYLSKGFIDSIDELNGKQRLLVKWVENDKLTIRRAVESRWLPLITPIDDTLTLLVKKPGCILARNIKSLESTLGASALCELVAKPHRFVCLVDTKNRVMEEVKENIPLSKINLYAENSNIALRDLVRLDSEGGEAMSETYCCSLRPEPEEGWLVTVISGSLRFLRHWNDSDSQVRIAIISPTETNYTNAVEFANELYRQRAREELYLPDDILSIKPSSIDIQLMYSQ